MSTDLDKSNIEAEFTKDGLTIKVIAFEDNDGWKEGMHLLDSFDGEPEYTVLISRSIVKKYKKLGQEQAMLLAAWAIANDWHLTKDV